MTYVLAYWDSGTTNYHKTDANSFEDARKTLLVWLRENYPEALERDEWSVDAL